LTEFSFAGKFAGGTIENIGFFDHVIAHAIEFSHQLIARVGREIDTCTDWAVVIATVAFLAVNVKTFGYIETNDDVNHIASVGLGF
jgi:uncharacterized membrane protein